MALRRDAAHLRCGAHPGYHAGRAEPDAPGLAARHRARRGGGVAAAARPARAGRPPDQAAAGGGGEFRLMLLLPSLDSRSWGQLVDEARRQIPYLAPHWTDHNASDPGI